MKNRIIKGAIKYITLWECGTCGHKHRKYNRAIDCLDKLEDHGQGSIVVETRYNPDLLWIEDCLLKHTDMYEMANALQG